MDNFPFRRESFADAMGLWVLLVRATACYTRVSEQMIGRASTGVRVSAPVRRARALLAQALLRITDDPVIARIWLRTVLGFSGQTVTRLLEYEAGKGEVAAVMTLVNNGFKKRSGEEWIRSAQAAGWFQ